MALLDSQVHGRRKSDIVVERMKVFSFYLPIFWQLYWNIETMPALKARSLEGIQGLQIDAGRVRTYGINGEILSVCFSSHGFFSEISGFLQCAP